jgi:aminoglycoside phosphotransferase (APT) family kinase protein
LLERRPTDPAIGVFHGDFQPSNFLFDGEDLVAILDWEISGIGPHLLDLGWLVVFSERESWDPSYAPLATAPSVVEIVSRYEEAVGRKVADLAYWRALAGYRFGAIDGFNVRLHRTRKRHDPMWEKLAPSVERLYGRAKELLTAP